MKQQHSTGILAMIADRSLISACTAALILLLAGPLHAEEPAMQPAVIHLGDYRFKPAEIQLDAGKPAVLRLVNTDRMVPHNFTLEAGDGIDPIDVDVAAGETVEVELEPLSAGRYTFYCDKKMVFMKSHRAKGMEGSLIVTAE